MLKLLVLAALGVGGYFIVKRLLAEDAGPVDADHYYPQSETPHPAS